MSSSFCVYCKTYWPREPEFETCPCCREETKLSQNQPNPDQWPESPARLAFGWYLWENDLL
jgi:predicted amidophosphoribosyltransferase